MTRRVGLTSFFLIDKSEEVHEALRETASFLTDLPDRAAEHRD